MSIRVYIPRDAAALSVGAEAVAEAISREAAARGQTIEIVRNGSRGMFWLEPLVEVETAQGRVAYGPVKPRDVASLLESGALQGGDHALRARPDRPARLDEAPAASHLRAHRDHRSAFARRLSRPWRPRGP